MDIKTNQTNRRPNWLFLLGAAAFVVGILLGFRAAWQPAAPIQPVRETASPISNALPPDPTKIAPSETPVRKFRLLPTPTPTEPVHTVYLPMQALSPRWIQPVERVLIISVDGLRPDAVVQNGVATKYAPYLFAFSQEGSASWSAKTVIPSITLPAHASMLTGYGVDQHGINIVHYDSIIAQHPYIQVPTIFKIARQNGYRTFMLLGKPKLEYLIQPDALDDVETMGSQFNDMNRARRARDWIQGGFGLMFVHLTDADRVGHKQGWMSREYLEKVRVTDNAIKLIINALKAQGLFESTLIIITSDHGGHDATHTSSTIEDLLIPWIIVGPGVLSNHNLSNPEIQVADTAATALWALDIQLPQDLAGRPVLEAFETLIEVGTP